MGITRSSVQGTTPVDSDIANLNAAVQDAMKQGVSRGIMNSSQNSHTDILVPQGIVLRKIIIFTNTLGKEIEVSLPKFVFLS
jgi:hypothetical protein